MSDCHFGVSPVNYPDPDPELLLMIVFYIFKLMKDLTNVLQC